MCFSILWLVWLIIVVAIVAIIKVVVPMIAAQLGSPGGAIVQIINIVLWAAVAIIVVYFAAEMIGCLIGMGGGTLFPRR